MKNHSAWVFRMVISTHLKGWCCDRAWALPSWRMSFCRGLNLDRSAKCEIQRNVGGMLFSHRAEGYWEAGVQGLPHGETTETTGDNNGLLVVGPSYVINHHKPK